jgi:hypothetical protein
LEVNGQLHTSAALLPWYSLDKRLSGAQRRSVCHREEINKHSIIGEVDNNISNFFHSTKFRIHLFYVSIIFFGLCPSWCQNGSVGIATGWTTEVRFLTGERNFSLHSVQADCGTKKLISNGYREALSPEVKRPRSEADNSSPSSVEVKNGGAVPPFLHASSWGGA